MSRFTEYKKWPPRLAAPTATVYQLVTLSLVFGLLPSYHCQLGQIAESAGRWQAPLHPCNSPRCQRAICPTPVQVERTQKVRLEPSPTGLRHSQARWRLRAWLSSDPAVSPKRQLNQSCSAAHILNPDLVRINNGMDLLVSSLATHCTFHGADTILRKMLHSDLMKFKPRAPPRKDKEKEKQISPLPGLQAFHSPRATKFGITFLVFSDEVTANQSRQNKGQSTWPLDQTSLLSLSQAATWEERERSWSLIFCCERTTF